MIRVGRFARERVEPFGPLTLYQMSWTFEEYRRCVKLAEYNREGRNPMFPGKAGEKVAESIQRKADRLAYCFPVFPKTLKLTDR